MIVVSTTKSLTTTKIPSKGKSVHYRAVFLRSFNVPLTPPSNAASGTLLKRFAGTSFTFCTNAPQTFPGCFFHIILSINAPPTLHKRFSHFPPFGSTLLQHLSHVSTPTECSSNASLVLLRHFFPVSVLLLPTPLPRS